MMTIFNPNISQPIGKWPPGPMILKLGGAPGSNWNPADKAANIVLTNNNLTTAANSGAWGAVRAVASDSSGKRFYEIHLDAVDSTTGGLIVGIGDATAALANYVGSDVHGWGWQCTAGTPRSYHNGVNPAYGAAAIVNDIVGILFDFATGNLTFYKNGTSQGVAYSGIAAGTYFPMISDLGTVPLQSAHFSSSSWVYPPGVGEVPW